MVTHNTRHDKKTKDGSVAGAPGVPAVGAMAATRATRSAARRGAGPIEAWCEEADGAEQRPCPASSRVRRVI